MILTSKECGIVGDGKTVNTEQINGAIERLAVQGGGELVFLPGTYLTGTVVLQSHIILRLLAGARIRSTGKREDYLADERTGGSIFEGEANMGGVLIYGENLHDVAILGQGVIDGNGIAITAGDKAHLYPEGKNHQGEDGYEFVNTWRPMTLKLNDCRNVTLEGVRFVNPASWNVGLNRCQDVFARGLDMKSHNFYNGDGLDCNSCERVFISDCSFDCTDDCIALQSAFPDCACKNITVSNCHFTTPLAGIRIGMACLGDFENITVENCTFENCGCSGLKIQQCETGRMENLIFRGLAMKNVTSPFFFTHNFFKITRFDLWKEERPFGTMKNILISDCVIENEFSEDVGRMVFDGTEGCPLENIVVRNVIYRYAFAGKIASEIPTPEGKRPERSVYTGQDGWGALLLRHCRNMTVEGLTCENDCKSEAPLAVIEHCNGVWLKDLTARSKGEWIALSLSECVQVDCGYLSEPIEIIEK